MRSRRRRDHQGSLGSLGSAQGFLGSSGDAGFVGVRSGGRQALTGVAGFIGGAPWRSPGPSRVDGFIVVRPGYLWVHRPLLGSLGCALGVVGFIRDYFSAHCGSSSSSMVAGFIDVCPGDRRDYP